MQKLMLFGTIVISMAILVVAQTVQPLNVKPGLWQVTMTTAVQGMGSQTHTYKSCVNQADLNRYPFADRENNCTYKVQSSTSSHMDVSGTCLPQEGGKADFKIQLDAVDTEDVKGTGQLTLAGPAGPVHGDYSGNGKWLSATCPAGVR